MSDIINIKPDTLIIPPGLTEEQRQDVIKLCKQENQEECPHCKFLAELFKEDQIESNREYWIMTEVFVYLHDGKDYCNHTHKG